LVGDRLACRTRRTKTSLWLSIEDQTQDDDNILVSLSCRASKSADDSSLSLRLETPNLDRFLARYMKEELEAGRLPFGFVASAIDAGNKKWDVKLFKPEQTYQALRIRGIVRELEDRTVRRRTLCVLSSDYPFHFECPTPPVYPAEIPPQTQ